MITNAQSLNARARNFAVENNLSVQQVLQNYMFERFLERLSKSEYREKFIIKGGLLLSSIIFDFIYTPLVVRISILSAINFSI